MGNCLRSQRKTVKIMKMDGKILEYRSSIKVNQILSEFKDHAISDMLPIQRYMQPNTELVAGNLYYLVPISTRPSKVERKKVRFSEPEVIQGREEKSSLRIKMVISKQELKELLEKGVISVDSIPQKDEGDTEEVNGYGSNTWKPSLESITEVD